MVHRNIQGNTLAIGYIKFWQGFELTEVHDFR